MKERPILFQGDMVRAILDGRKTQTRRIVKDPSFYGCLTGDCPHEKQTECDAAIAAWAGKNCPHGQPGDRLFAKETFRHICEKSGTSCIQYRADMAALKSWATDGGEGDFVKVEGNADSIVFEGKEPPWKPSIFMPRWASRITLEIVSVRVERVQEITEEDAEAEGVLCAFDNHPEPPAATAAYRRLWDRINSKTHPWLCNPWVWVVEFKRVK